MGELKIVEKGVRVLVIEDDPDDRELLLFHLRKSQMDSHVRFFSDGKEARDYLTGPDISSIASEMVAIFLDLKLPKIGGLELLRMIRKNEALQKIPVIVMTASNDPDNLEECRRLKVTNYVSKPVTITSFSKAVADVFHQPKREIRSTAVE